MAIPTRTEMTGVVLERVAGHMRRRTSGPMLLSRMT
jgi:hypothetical protein